MGGESRHGFQILVGTAVALSFGAQSVDPGLRSRRPVLRIRGMGTRDADASRGEKCIQPPHQESPLGECEQQTGRELGTHGHGHPPSNTGHIFQ